MVKVGKLWGDARFTALSSHSKLLYLYLVTHPSISTLGVLTLNRKSIELDLNIGVRLAEVSIEELEEDGWIHHQLDGSFDVFIIRAHFLSLSKSKLNIRKAIDEGKNSRYRDALREIYEPTDFEPSLGFVPPYLLVILVVPIIL